MKKTTTKKSTSRRARPALTKREYDPSEWDESQAVAVTPEPRPLSGISTSIRLPSDMIRKLRRIAAKKGDIGYQTLIKIWIAERLEVETKKRAG
jgi:predicted DNA binding CopG/RHH family protein